MLPAQRSTLKKFFNFSIQKLSTSSRCKIASAFPTENRSHLGLASRNFGTSLCKPVAEAVETTLKSTVADAPLPKENEERGSSSNNASDPESIDWYLISEIEKYKLGKRWLATMMGEDVETFTDEKIDEAIKYLLPSHLFAKDARPVMMDPIKLFGKGKEKQIGADRRPLSFAFYSGQPAFHELIFKIWESLEKLDQLKPEESIFEGEEETNFFYDKPLLVRWMKQHEMEEKLDCRLKEEQYDLLIRRLTRIANHPMGETMQDFLSTLQVEITQGGKKIEVTEIDEDGYVTVMGYRKTAIAEVRMKEGSGKILVNNMPMTRFFPKFEHRQQVLYPFMVIDQLGKFDVDAGVIGGGETGKAGAMRLGISRALLSFSKSFHQPLEEAGLLVRDRRKVERKKPGRKKARRKFAWVKR